MSHFRWPYFLAVWSSAGFIFLFLLVMHILPMFTGRRVDLSLWEIETPRAIYLATFLGTVSYISMVWMIWPAYHIFSIPIVFFELAGIIAFIGLF
jgi:hypothetical protein